MKDQKEQQEHPQAAFASDLSLSELMGAGRLNKELQRCWEDGRLRLGGKPSAQVLG